MRGRIQDLLDITAGELLTGSPETLFAGVSTDSRTITRGELFVALAGENFDGHAFVGDAVARDAAAVLVMRPVDTRALPMVLVPDTLAALGALAAHFRRDFAVRILGITGSAGKTTVKEMSSAILSLAGATLKTQKNYNNLIGVPMRLLDLRPEHTYAVIEMGTNSPGEIDRLAGMAIPEAAILTAITPSHLNGLGSVAGICREKAAIFAHTTAAAVINPHGAYMDQVAVPSRLARVTFSVSGPADAALVRILSQTLEGTDILADLGGRQRRLHVKLPGLHNVLNALAAAAGALALGIDPDTIVAGIEAATFPGMRSEIIVAETLTIIDDSYNANPGSMQAALDMLKAAPHAHKVAVLGDMLELGPESPHFHAQLGQWVAQARLDRLIVTGAMATVVADAAVGAGMPHSAVTVASDMPAIEATLQTVLTPESCVLVKASRGLKLDRVVTFLKAVA